MAVRYVCDGCGDEFKDGFSLSVVEFPHDPRVALPILHSRHLCKLCMQFVFVDENFQIIGEARKKPPASNHPMQGIVDAAKRVADKMCTCSASVHRGISSAGLLYCPSCGGRRRS